MNHDMKYTDCYYYQFRWRMGYLAALLLLALVLPAQAQWQSQTIELDEGWNTVFLHVDTSHVSLDSMIASDGGNPITQIWRWIPPPNAQYFDDPNDEVLQVNGWAKWIRNDVDSPLKNLEGQTAYLVETHSNYVWTVKGRLVAPQPTWNSAGINLVGIPATPDSPPSFEQFLAEADPDLLSTLEIYRYSGASGIDASSVLLNPSLYRTLSVDRSQAYWMRTTDQSKAYFGPFEVILSTFSGVNFQDSLSAISLRLRNVSENELTVSLDLTTSEEPPAGQEMIDGVPPLLIRGDREASGLVYGYSELQVGNSNHSWTLAAKGLEGSEVEVVLGLDRAAITAEVGSLLAGILKFTDSLGHLEINIPVSNEIASDAGLWVGDALVTQVGQYLKSYARTGDDALVVSSNGAYAVTGIDTSITDVAKPFPLRLIVHNPTNGPARLVQQIFSGMGNYSNQVLTLNESVLDSAQLDTARRISVSHLPWSKENEGWLFDGSLAQGTEISASVMNAYNEQTSNPFLHTYHPDHDNLDAPFKNELAQGSESYTIVRDINLQIDPPGTNFLDRISAGETFYGMYEESIQVQGLARAGGTNDTRQFEVRGVFKLNRISDIPVLTDPL